jgi:DNA-binding response OmpR family regulator
MSTIEPTVAIASIDTKFTSQLSERLVSDNCRVIVVSEMNRLAEQIRGADVHVAVVDLDAGNGQCRRLIEDLRALDRHVGLIVAARYCSEDDEVFLRMNGVSYVAPKPTEFASLAKIVRKSATKVARQRYC